MGLDLRLYEDLVERRERVRLRLHREGVLHLEGDRVRVSVGVLHLVRVIGSGLVLGFCTWLG